MPRIYISYRREDTAYPAAWVFDRLEARFGKDRVFKDVDSIAPGEDYVERITSAVGSCDVLLALVGEEWLTAVDESGGRRLDDPSDFVRVEIEAALARDVRVVPVLVDGAAMPSVDELPPSLAPFARRQALELSPQRFDFDTERLLDTLETATSDEERVERPTRSPLSRPALVATGAGAALLLALGAGAMLLLRDDDSDPTAAAVQTGGATSDDWVAEANAICERTNETIDDLPEPNAASLDTLGADALVGFGTAALNVNKRMVRDLGELEPPEEDADDHRELVARGAAVNEAAEELFAAFKVGDFEGVQRHQTALSAAGSRFDAHAIEIGATTCAEGASLPGATIPTG